MKRLRLSFLQMLYFMQKDMMLLIICISPLFSGLLFKFAIPALEKFLTEWASTPFILTPYYRLFDMFFATISPVMFCLAAAMIVLEEMDEHIAGYLFITPLGRLGYLISRLGIPAVIAFIATLILLPIFKLTNLHFGATLFLSIGGTLQGLIITLLVVTLSSNKLEGIAVTKLSMFMILGFALPYLLQGNMQYILSPLPSFWIGKAIYEEEAIYILLSILSSLIWIHFLMKKFLRKLA